jgi:S1-C subfamily serine protease
MAVIPPLFTNCVVAIGQKDQTGAVRWVASGFFYGKMTKAHEDPQKREYGVYLVTNKHVLANQTEIFVRVNPTAAGPARQFDANLVNPVSGDSIWTGHDSTEVDVAVLGINYQMLLDQEMAVSFFTSDMHALSVQDMVSSEISEGDSVFAMGFPMGLVGEERNTVIVRGGVLARIRDTLAKPDFPFMIDTTVFPGNSGGPVVSKPELVAIQGTKSHKAAYLIGIIASYVPYIDVAVSQQTQRPRVTFEENSGLANAYSVDCINQAIEKAEIAAGGNSPEEAQPVESEVAGNGDKAASPE